MSWIMSALIGVTIAAAVAAAFHHVLVRVLWQDEPRSTWSRCPRCGERSLWSMGGLGLQRDVCVACGSSARATVDCKAHGCDARVEAAAYLRQHGFCTEHAAWDQLRQRRMVSR